MSSVGIHPPKTPVTTGSHGIAKATLPNVCKMPGPPAPFVPSPLPNIAKSGLSPKDFSKTVKIDGNTVAIRGATFKSMGDMASKGTGGGLISANTHGPAKFITPGSMTVKIESKSVHLLGEPMLNNCGPNGSPPNTGASMMGVSQANQGGKNPLEINCADAPESPKPGRKKFTKCEKEEICAKCAEVNKQAKSAGGIKEAKASYDREEADKMCKRLKRWARTGSAKHEDLGGFKHLKSQECRDELSNKAKRKKYRGFSPDHRREIQHCGHPTRLSNLKWMSSRPNSWMGTKLKAFKTTAPDKHTGVKPDCCD